MTTIAFIVITAAVFVAAVVNLALESTFKKRLMAVAAAATGCLGVLLYGYGFCWVYGPSLLAVIKALFAVCRMFSGVNDLGAIQAAPLFANEMIQVVFWLAHFMGFYVTASAAITIIGGKLLHRIRVLMLRRGALVIIYGANGQAIEYGRKQSSHQRSVLFVDGGCEAAAESAIHAFGAVLEKSTDALSPTAGFLRRIGLGGGRRKLEVAALQSNGAENLNFARQLLKAMEEQGIGADQTPLLLRDVDEEAAAELLSRNGSSGYGTVLAFDDYTLAARVLVRKLPPCHTIPFGGDGRAQADFHGVLVGFGRMGRSVLEQWIMNGQFEGSAFRVDVFDPHPQNGPLFGHPMLEDYDVRFHEANASSTAFYRFLDEHKKSIRCLVLCTGNEACNGEVARDVQAWMKNRSISLPVAECTAAGILTFDAQEQTPCFDSLYGGSALDLATIDRMAMAINQAYCGSNGKTAPENWQACDAFSRLSSRASADFYPAVLRAADRTQDQIAQGQWPPESGILENLARTEHLRWCAFHRVMRFRTMPEEIFEQRTRQYWKEVSESGNSSLRIGKDMVGRTHACLIGWDELDELSRRENAITGSHVDYKQMDRDNVLALPGILGNEPRGGDKRA